METIQILLLVANLLLLVGLFLRKSDGSVTKISKPSNRQVVLDSCALIDGRIVELAEAGFTPEKIIIPSFIIRELQMLADGNDSHKRERARFGLDTANRLKELARVTVEIDRREMSEVTTDDKLVAFSQATGALLYTTDFNLAKVAEVEGVKVLNVNELAQKLKPTLLPGERMTIKIVQKGSSRGQGVGYTDDGTMVVVEQSDRLIGKSVDVVVDRMLGTLAGKMIFAKIPSAPKSKPAPRPLRKPRVEPTASDEFVSDLRKEIS